MENKEVNRSDSRSKRSHTNLANLRLAPLSTDFISNIPPVSDTEIGYQSHHSSYIQGKSAPSTPGILGRSSSRRQLGAGLSQKLSWYDTDTPSYAAVQVNRDGVPLSTRSAATALNGLPKAQSDAALLTQRRTTNSKLHTQLSHHSGAPVRHHRRSQTGGRPRDGKEDDWFTRAGLTTTSLLRESKGQSWLTSRHSSTSLHQGDSSDEDAKTLSYLSASSHLRLHFADDELSPETPRYTSRWGSRFGSRAASARNSRRGSSVDLALTPTIVVSREDGYFGDFAPRNEEPIGPDFVDVEDGSDGEDPEEEIARLARERSSGFVGGLVDRLVGWSLFNVDEDREATDVEDEGDRDGASRVVKTTARPLPARNRQVLDPGQLVEEPRPERQEEGGWHDAAWLLSLASKVIL